MSAPRALLGASAALFLVLLTACGEGRGAAAPTRALPAYEGRATALFDDTIEPAAVGLDYDRGYSPKADPQLRERSQTSDAIVRVRLTTITGLGEGQNASYRVSFTTIEKLAGEHPPESPFTVLLNRASDSHGIVRSMEGRLVGYSFVAFVRAFARADGEAALHFHLAPDSKEVRAAVEEAIVLGVLK